MNKKYFQTKPVLFNTKIISMVTTTSSLLYVKKLYFVAFVYSHVKTATTLSFQMTNGLHQKSHYRKVFVPILYLYPPVN